jgi:hypothetical protein
MGALTRAKNWPPPLGCLKTWPQGAKTAVSIFLNSRSSETVCRSMTELQQRGTIALQGPREVRLLDRDAFEVI